MNKINVKILACSKEYIPTYESELAAGADVKARLESPIEIAPGERKLVPAGFRVSLPEGYEMQVRPRSGLAIKKGITVLNSPGTVDADYRGEVGIILINLGYESFIVNPGDRIAQVVINEVPQANFVQVDSLDETERGEGGFGHTGK